MDNAIDLHVHSTHSDGTYSPRELVEYAKNINLKAIALTDHDCLDGNDEMQTLCNAAGIEFVPGIELSCSYTTNENKEIEVHMLGLFITETKEFNEYLIEYRKTRDVRNMEMITKLNEIGFNIDYSDFVSYFPKCILTRAHIARYMYDKEMIPSISTAFDKYIGDNRPCYVSRKRVCAQDAISYIHNAGGLAFVAHPTLYHLDNKGIRILLSDLKEHGLDGVEAIYSTYKNEEEALIKQYAKENDLLISGGSDFHGSNKPYIHLGSGRGNLHVPYSIYESILQATK